MTLQPTNDEPSGQQISSFQPRLIQDENDETWNTSEVGYISTQNLDGRDESSFQAALEDESSTSSLSCGDADSVIYVGPREAFKCVEELMVAAEESLCLQQAADRDSPSPPGPGVR